MHSVIAILNYGVGNLRSVFNAIEKVGGRPKITSDQDEIREASAIVFPGVGAFRPAMEKIKSTEYVFPEVPKLGICLGMQLFATRSFENGVHSGLNYIPGDVVRFPLSVRKIPHMGWNELKIRKNIEILDGIEDGSMVYFVHSYYLRTEERFVVAETDYGITFPSVVACKDCFGFQFHPEKSGKVGLEILKNFVQIVRR